MPSPRTRLRVIVSADFPGTNMSKRNWVIRHLAQQGNKNPSEESIEVMLIVLDNDSWVKEQYKKSDEYEEE